jgi:predicted transcriptional regulator
MTVYLPAPLKREFDKLADQDGRSLSDIARSLIAQALREKRLASAAVK